MWVKDFLTLGISVAALVLALVNFVRTSRLSNLQYKLTYNKPLLDWALEVMDLSRDFLGFAMPESSASRNEMLDQFLRKLFAITYRGEIILAARHGFSLIWFESHVLSTLKEMIKLFDAMCDENSQLKDGINPFKAADQFMALVDQFREAVISEMNRPFGSTMISRLPSRFKV